MVSDLGEIVKYASTPLSASAVLPSGPTIGTAVPLEEGSNTALGRAVSVYMSKILAQIL